jgi:hypothetical protein
MPVSKQHAASRIAAVSDGSASPVFMRVRASRKGRPKCKPVRAVVAVAPILSDAAPRLIGHYCRLRDHENRILAA